jgi:menaquinone-9 beta-reductase
MDLGVSLYPGGNAMIYPVAVLGGGLAGLAVSIELRKKGHDVIVFEKSSYPRHKVCGEYVSNESRPYLGWLCPEIFNTQLPVITKFRLSSTGHATYDTTLEPGGFGISRYQLEHHLYEKAVELGVIIKTMTKVTSVDQIPGNQLYTITTYCGRFYARLVLNATGQAAPSAKTNLHYVGVKYHVKLERDRDQIEIHNFRGGYCGISAIENEKNCLCYMVDSRLLREHQNSIPILEKIVLRRNKLLRKILDTAEFLPGFPVTMSGFEFKMNQCHEDGKIFLGDAAGRISPLTGNGMSNALRSAKMLAGYIDDYLNDHFDQEKLLRIYSQKWKSEFSARIITGGYLQGIGSSTVLTKTSIGLFNLVPALGRYVVRRTHGKVF